MLAVERAPSLLLCVLSDADFVAPHWEAMLDALDAVSPLVDDVRPGHAYVDMCGAPGNVREWIAQTHATLVPYGLAVRIGAGTNKFAAYAAAQNGDGTICAAGNERAFLAPLSLDVLGVDGRIRERLRMLGIATLGELARLPHGPFVRRFGMQAAQWHACARGEDRTPFLPRAHAIAIEASAFGEGSIEEQAQLFFALRVVLARVCADLERCGKRAGALELTLELEDGNERRVDVPVALPSADERMLGDVLRAKLYESTFASPIVGLRIRAARLEEGGEAMSFFPADDVDPRRVAVALARLEATTGEPPRRAHIRAAHALERQFSYEPFASLAVVPNKASGAPEALVAHLRLLAVREIGVVVKRGAPAVVDGRSVTECKGPWRIEEGWFADAPIARDEYDVLLDDASRLRIYRQGSRWYLRGAYD